MNNATLQRIIAFICILFGIAIVQVHADQEFIRLSPSEGSAFLVSVKEGVKYEQSFIVQSKTLSKIGVYLQRIQTKAKFSSEVIRIELLKDGVVVSDGAIQLSRINDDGPSLITLDPKITTKRNEKVSLRVTVAQGGSGLVALQKRMFDETFSSTDVSFSIDGVTQDYPIGYAVYESIWPPFVRQLGGLLVLAGIVPLGWKYVSKARNYSALAVLVYISFLYAIPSFGIHTLFFPVTTICIVAFWAVLRLFGRSVLAAAFGACIFGCSTWLPLAFITGWQADGMLPIRDALIDPNQISVSHGAGGYIGIPGALFAVVGILIYAGMLLRKRFTPSQGESIMVIVLIVSLAVTFIESSFQYSNGIIVVVACIAWFASLTFDRMQRFLGIRDLFIQVLMTVFFCISLLDLMYITSRTFTYGLGI